MIEEMEHKVLAWSVGTVCILAFLAAAGWAACIYAFVETPNLNEVVLEVKGNPQVLPKSFALFSFPALQTLIFLILLVGTLRRKKIIWRMTELVSPRDLWQPRPAGVDFASTVKTWCAALCLMSGFMLYAAIDRVWLVLSS
jgi:hypothetical protein